MLNENYDVSGDYSKTTVGSSLACSHQVIKCIKLDSRIMKVDL